MQKIRIDFDNPGLPQHISAVENDSQSRFFQATLYENGKAYTAPEGAAYSIMYRGFGPQNQGWYDTINDGAGKRSACAVSGNVVTCEIARQALQVPGHVSIVLCVTTGKGYMIKSWPIECDCKNDRYDSTAEIQSFFYVTQVSNADWNRIIQALEDLKNTIDPTLSLSGKAADAKKTGDKIGQLKEDILDTVINLIDVNKLDLHKQINNDGDHGEYQATPFYCTGKIKILTNAQYVFSYKKDIPARFVIRTENDEVKTVFHYDYDKLPSFVTVNNGYMYFTVPSSDYNNDKYVYIDLTGWMDEKDTDFFVLSTYNDIRLERLIITNKKEIENLRQIVQNKKYNIIKCVGDSQTGGSDNFTPWTEVLQNTYLPNKKIINYGNGGENVNAICYRCGVLNLIVEPFTLPADTSQVSVNAHFENNAEKGNLFIAWNNSNPVTIDGISCYLRNIGTIARVESANEPTTFSRPVYAIPPDPLNDENMYIFLMGQNGGFNNVDEYFNDCYKCISECSKYIIMLPYTESFLSKVNVTYDALLNKACSIFGKNVFDVKTYLIKYGLDDNNLQATDSDNEDIANNHVPRQLYADYDIHLNQYGLNAQAKGVYLFGKYNGYWS